MGPRLASRNVPTAPRPPLHGRLIRLLMAAGLALVAGCGIGKDTTGTGTGDATGLRLGVYASDRGQAVAGQYDLYLWDYDTGKYHNINAVNSTAADRPPSSSRDGRFIAYQVNRGTGMSDDVEMYDRSKNAFVDLPGLNTTAAENEPSFTGNGLRLCYVQEVDGRRRIRLY